MNHPVLNVQLINASKIKQRYSVTRKQNGIERINMLFTLCNQQLANGLYTEA